MDNREDLLNRVADMLSYHPPQTTWRQEAHGNINDAAFSLVKIFVALCPNLTEQELNRVMDLVQQARMTMNLILTNKEVVDGITDEDVYNEQP